MRDDNDTKTGPKPAALHAIAGEPLLAQLEQQWWQLASDNELPRRRDVSAAMMGAALPHGFIIERIAPGHARLRVAGQKISDAMGTEARGMPISVLMSAGSRPRLAELLDQVFDRASIVDLPIEAVRRLSLKRIKGRMLMLPLKDDHGEVTRAVGALVLDGPQSGAPVRCTIADDRPQRVEPFRMAKSGLEIIDGDRRIPFARRASNAPSLRLIVNNSDKDMGPQAPRLH